MNTLWLSIATNDAHGNAYQAAGWSETVDADTFRHEWEQPDAFDITFRFVDGRRVSADFKFIEPLRGSKNG